MKDEYVEFCKVWHTGQSSMMYAVASTGNLTEGTDKPPFCKTKEDHLFYLYSGLSAELFALPRKYMSEEEKELRLQFEQYCDAILDFLSGHYDISEDDSPDEEYQELLDYLDDPTGSYPEPTDPTG